MNNLSESELYVLKDKKLRFYWTKYVFLRKRIYNDFMYLFTDFKNPLILNFLIDNESFNSSEVFEKLLNLRRIVEKSPESHSERFVRGKWFFNKKSIKVSNETIIEDIDKLYNSLTFQVTRNFEA